MTTGDDRKIDQIEKQLNKLVDVAALQDITIAGHLEREVVLVKIKVEEGQVDALQRIVRGFNASLSEVSQLKFIVEMSGSCEKVDELLNSLSNGEIIEVARSGAIGLASGEQALVVPD